jgi:hypothetical protein
MHETLKLTKPRIDMASFIAGGITVFGVCAFAVHTDSPASAWCALHIVPLPFLGWVTSDLPTQVVAAVALVQLLLGFIAWSFMLRVFFRVVSVRRTAV